MLLSTLFILTLEGFCYVTLTRAEELVTLTVAQAVTTVDAPPGIPSDSGASVGSSATGPQADLTTDAGAEGTTSRQAPTDATVGQTDATGGEGQTTAAATVAAAVTASQTTAGVTDSTTVAAAVTVQDAVADVTNATVLETNTGTSPATVTDTGSSAGMAGGNTSIAGNTTVATAAAVDADAAGNVTDGWTTAADGDSVTTAENITDGMNTNVTSVVATTPVPESNATTEGGNLQTTAQEATTAAPIIYSWPEDHVCNNYTTLDGDRRHFSVPVEGGRELSDTALSGWYAFTYQGAPAVITPTCIKEKYCSTFMPYHLELAGADLPQVGDNLTTWLCGPGQLAGQVGCCLQKSQVTIVNCGDQYIYSVKPLKLKMSAICVQLPDEEVPVEYLAISPTVTTPEPTTMEPKRVLPTVDYTKLSAAQKAGVVTVEYNYPKNTENFETFLVEKFDPKFRKMIIDKLNNMSAEEEKMTTTSASPTTTSKEEIITFYAGDYIPPGVKAPSEAPKIPNIDADADAKGPADTRKKREAAKPEYSVDDATYVGPTPQAGDGAMQTSLFVEDPDSGAVPASTMMDALDQLEQSGELGKEVNLTVIRYYEGLPASLQPAASREDQGVWDRHRGLLIALIVIASICLLVILIAICCIKCRRNRGSWSRDDEKATMEEGRSKKRPMAVENPLPDEEITKDEGPMVERDNPAMTSNGGGGHLSKKDEDNGWVVPIDELTKSDKDKPEVEDTKL